MQAGVQASSSPEQALVQRVIRTGDRSRACLLVLAGSLGGPCDDNRGHSVSHHVRAHHNRLQLPQQDLQHMFTCNFSIQFLLKATQARAAAIMSGLSGVYRDSFSRVCSTLCIPQGSGSLGALSRGCITARSYLHAACQ